MPTGNVENTAEDKARKLRSVRNHQIEVQRFLKNGRTKGTKQ